MAIEFLCHFDGTNGSTVFVDETGNYSLTAIGSAALTTTGQVFGTACLNVADGKVAIASSIPFFSLNHTIRFRYTPHSDDLTGSYRTVSAISYAFVFVDSGNLLIELDFADSVFTTINCGAITSGVSYAISIERYGDTFYIYLDGVLVDSYTKSGDVFSGMDFGIGQDGSLSIKGLIDEYLIDIGESYALGALSYSLESVPFEFDLLNIRAYELNSTPSFDAADVTQIYVISATELTSIPSFNTASVSQVHSVGANPITSTPSLTPAFVGITETIGANPLTSIPSVTSATVGQINTIGTNELTSTPSVTQASVSVVHPVGAYELTSIPTLTSASVSQVHAIGAYPLTVTPSVSVLDDVFLAFSFSPENKAITTYSNFPYTGSCVFNGKTLLTNSNGIFEYGGYLDDTAPIVASLKTGKMNDISGTNGNRPSTKIKRIPDAKIRIDCDKSGANGIIDLNVIADDSQTFNYENAIKHTGYATHRVPIGRGIKFNYVQFEIIGTGCESINISSIEYSPKELTRSER